MLRKVIQSIVKAWFAAFIAALTFLAAQEANAGVVIIDGRADKPLTSDAPPAPPPDCNARPLTETEQKLYILTAILLNGHEAALEEANGELEVTDDGTQVVSGELQFLEFEPAPEGCNAASPGLLGAIFTALALGNAFRKRGRRI